MLFGVSGFNQYYNNKWYPVSKDQIHLHIYLNHMDKLRAMFNI